MPRLTSFQRDLAVAITRVETKFCSWTNRNLSTQSIERVFAYELYHQFRSLTSNNADYAELRIDGEITKLAPQNVDYCGCIEQINFNTNNYFSPDLVLHLSQTDSTYENQKLIIEIKTSTSTNVLNRHDATKDIIKLNHCIKHLNYQAGVFISVNTDYRRTADIFSDMFRLPLDSRRATFERIIIFNYNEGILHYQNLYNLTASADFIVFQQYSPTTALAQAVTFDDSTMHVQLTDGRTVSVPLLWFPRLLAARPEQRAQVAIGGGGRGLHWDELDEDLSVAGLLAGGN